MASSRPLAPPFAAASLRGRSTLSHRAYRGLLLPGRQPSRAARLYADLTVAGWRGWSSVGRRDIEGAACPASAFSLHSVSTG
jgi:hypothetical protein